MNFTRSTQRFRAGQTPSVLAEQTHGIQSAGLSGSSGRVFTQHSWSGQIPVLAKTTPGLQPSLSGRVRQSLFQHQVELANPIKEWTVAEWPRDSHGFYGRSTSTTGTNSWQPGEVLPTSNSQRAAAITEEVANEPLDYLSDDDCSVTNAMSRSTISQWFGRT